jgi:hypothetical protein
VRDFAPLIIYRSAAGDPEHGLQPLMRCHRRGSCSFIPADVFSDGRVQTTLLAKLILVLPEPVFTHSVKGLESLSEVRKSGHCALAAVHKAIEFKVHLSHVVELLTLCNTADLTADVWCRLASYELILSQGLIRAVHESGVDPLFAMKLCPREAS